MEILVRDYQKMSLHDEESALLSVAKRLLFVVDEIVYVSTWNELSPAFYKKSQLPAFRDATALIDKRNVDVTMKSNDFIVSIQFVIILKQRGKKALSNPAGVEASILDKKLKKDAPRGGY